MKSDEPDRSWHVILSAAKNLTRRTEILFLNDYLRALFDADTLM